ncbi:MAG: GntR family transcriptional regulator [Firmicutes bacterium HGW-Firmicutes-1]|jgi:GntR family transcriptional regulator|nr:MAG: GntR family transcriptional regulator [Firmicutes bacterium HGW-Firmicutes-1]
MTQIEKFQQYTLDKSAIIPLYFQVKNLLVDMLVKGHLSPGDMIPTEYELCTAFNISRTTIRQALTELVQEGVFYRVKGRGTFVTQEKIHHNLCFEKSLFTNALIEKGITPSTRVLELKTIPAPIEVATSLNLPVGTDIISLKRLRYADNEPVLISHSYLPYSLCKHIYQHDLNNDSLAHVLSKSIYTKLAHTHYSLEAAIATKEDCDLLSISKTTAILFAHSLGYNKFDTPIDYTLSRYRGDKNVFIMDQLLD